ncbi:hypothetical protein GGR50DRAFT_146241 [Xylaria sp. CBS 124048]|nr:hypothetical protein GGR50DRAFT_146241 [Xylaria sp. CBS 124048]
MGLSKWKFGGSRKHTTTTTTTTSSANNSDDSTSISSSTLTMKPSSQTTRQHERDGRTRSAPSSSPFSWLRSSLRSSKRKSSGAPRTISRDDPAFARLHKPFTPQNLEHQKLLGAFEWQFYNNGDANGADDGDDRRRRRRRPSLISSLSPCASRNPSMDGYTHA